MFRKSAFTLSLLACALVAQTQRPQRQQQPADADGVDSALRGGGTQTMKQLARGTEYAAASMMPQATLAAEHVLRSGGNAFDAIVAGQAVLGVVQPNMNGMGSDAVLLVYDAKAKKVWSINAEGTAPKLATIDWYKKNKDGKIPTNDSLLSGTVPGVVDAWYILLSRWGTKTFGELLAPAIEMAEKGMPVTRAFNSAALMKWPSSAATYRPPDGTRWNDNEVFKNPDLARTFRRLVEAEKAAGG
ncbi:MAG TPA: gamma-glutamyltransferase, partial [Candidatus Solibacter sp.]|nr:gamma-glutamyltransferase [Candidatus Solibacter sp.]